MEWCLSLTSADKQPGGIPRLAGSSTEDVFAFLLATVEYQRTAGIWDNVIYTPFVEVETQKAVISQLKAKGLSCTIHLRGSGLDWYFSPGSLNPEGDYYAAASAQSSLVASAFRAPPNSKSAKSASMDETDGKMQYDDLVMRWSLIATIFGIVYGAFNGDIIHGFMVGFVVGLIPAIPLFLFAPFVLVWEKFFEKN